MSGQKSAQHITTALDRARGGCKQFVTQHVVFPVPTRFLQGTTTVLLSALKRPAKQRVTKWCGAGSRWCVKRCHSNRYNLTVPLNTEIYQNPPKSIKIYRNLPKSTEIHRNLLKSNEIHLPLPYYLSLIRLLSLSLPLFL